MNVSIVAINQLNSVFVHSSVLLEITFFFAWKYSKNNEFISALSESEIIFLKDGKG